MDIPGIDKIVGILEKNAGLIGGAYGILEDPLADGRGLTQAPAFIFGRLKAWKIPDPEKVLNELMYGRNYKAFRTGIMAAIGGYLLKEIGGDINPTLGRIGNTLQKVGTGAAVGSTVGALLWLPAVNPHGSGNRGSPSGYEY